MKKFKCEYCEGIAEEQIIDKHFKHKGNNVKLEKFPAFICNKCGQKYYSAKVLKEVIKRDNLGSY